MRPELSHVRRGHHRGEHLRNRHRRLHRDRPQSDHQRDVRHRDHGHHRYARGDRLRVRHRKRCEQSLLVLASSRGSGDCHHRNGYHPDEGYQNGWNYHVLIDHCHPANGYHRGAGPDEDRGAHHRCHPAEACPGWTHTGYCPDAGHPNEGRDEALKDVAR